MSWEWIKYRMREFSINFSKRIARESKRGSPLLLQEAQDVVSSRVDGF